MCASCHAKDLSGESGFNLKDGEWIHGSRPSQIVSNIQNGFMSAGMPGFGAVYSEEQITDIVTYILSKREGFENLSFKLYQMNSTEDSDVKDSKLVKSGVLANNFADFSIPEMQHYYIEFEGNFYTHQDKVTRLWSEVRKGTDITLDIDGERAPLSDSWRPAWQLKKGKQHLKIGYFSRDDEAWIRDTNMLVTNYDDSIKLFAVSTRGRQKMAGKKVEVKATSKTLVQRKRILKVPAYSIAVGLPAKVNYAFNTRSCAVVGLWQGEMINVGPNVDGRGQDASIPLGDWIFHSPEVLATGNKKHKCRYQGYSLLNGEPVFKYTLGHTQYRVTALAENSREIQFNYVVQTPVQNPIKVNVPQVDKLRWLANGKPAEKTEIDIKPDEQGQFSLVAKF